MSPWAHLVLIKPWDGHGLPEFIATRIVSNFLKMVLIQTSCIAENHAGGVADTFPPASTEFNTDFSSWLPRYQKPSNPCDYCRSKSLECFIYNADGPGQSGCSPCNALFRPCSFSNPEKMPALRQRTALDTLDVVAENDPRHFGGLTGKKQMRSLGHMGPIEDDNQGEQGPKKGAAAARFPRAAIKILKDWMLVHIDHPYPTEEDKESLKEQTGLSIGQISNWMANTRRRQKARPKRSSSPSIRPSTEAINIPPGRTWESLSTYTTPESTKSHKTRAFATDGRFLTFRVSGKQPNDDCTVDSQTDTLAMVPVSQQQNCFG